MGDEPILAVIQPIIIDTMLTEYRADIKNEKIGLNFVTCEQSLRSRKIPTSMRMVKESSER